ncbi:Phosphate-specific transport system accessory protein PhoU [Methanocorpusculaceae archaeon Sp1]|uniref:Phosphate-specific transport system accessory protein PhoU n=1 Tax=Methanorbis furvi TaxID=3028299 RepID=A0AAE4MC02_9EURY|nr:Phosphate-specific transport system accessory protein PhoU [Methanocorpusculaceae archaeon Sp1]MDV0441315.1 Phosphate-specific transport system accessory protein PhoU [Methanocorpusculaceae archaeon Ag1]
MNEYFHLELGSYKDQVNWYGRFALGMLKNSLMAFETIDREVAADVVRQKEYIASQYDLLNERGVLLIALNQPMAADLRLIACSLDMITSSERVGRYGKDVGELLVQFENRDHVARLASQLSKMGTITVSMLDVVYNSFATGDTESLSALSAMEEEVDQMYDVIYADCVAAMEADVSVVPQCSAYHMINRYLERCADHACRMGEKVYYMQTGKRVAIDHVNE